MANTLVQSVVRALDILELAASSAEGIRLGDIARSLSVSEPTAHNLARTLVAKGFLEKTSRPIRYQLGASYFAVGRRFQERAWRRCAEGVVRELSSSLPGATVVLAERLGNEPIPILRVDALRPEVLEHVQHLPLPTYSSAIALCFQAFLSADEVAVLRRRYPFNEYGLQQWGKEEEVDRYLEHIRVDGVVEVTSHHPFRVAAPIFGGGGQLVGSVAVSLKQAVDPVPCDVRRKVREAVLLAARSLSGSLENWKTPVAGESAAI